MRARVQSAPKHGALRRRWFRAAVAIALCLTPALRTRSAVAQAPAAPAAATSDNGAQTTPEARFPEKNQQEADENDKYRHSPTVAAIGKVLGMDPEQAGTAFEVLNFVVLAGLIGWFLARALPKTFRNRTGVIQKQLVDARSATEEANGRLNKVEGRLSKLDDEIAALRTQAESAAAEEEQRMRATVEEEKGKIVAAAEQEITTATAQARRQIQLFAAELAIDQAAKKLVVSAETDRLLVQEFARRLADKSPRGGQN